MSIVFKDYETKEIKIFLVCDVIKINPYRLDLVEIELRNGKNFKAENVRFFN